MKNILITGATSGLGLMLSRHYDSKGFNLITVGKDSKKLKMLKNEVSSKNKKIATPLILMLEKIMKNSSKLLIVNQKKLML